MHSVREGILAHAVVVVKAPPRAPLPDGTCIGPYRIRSLIASGGMGDVYRAHDERYQSIRDVALDLRAADEPRAQQSPVVRKPERRRLSWPASAIIAVVSLIAWQLRVRMNGRIALTHYLQMCDVVLLNPPAR